MTVLGIQPAISEQNEKVKIAERSTRKEDEHRGRVLQHHSNAE
jgi:hypothetical protein